MDWYALHTKPNKEEIAWRLVRQNGHQVFYPRLPAHPVNPRARKVRPYFPGYMFVRMELEQVGPAAFHFIPHVGGLVSFGGEPARVPEALIYALQTRIQEAVAKHRDPLQGVARGDAVVIRDGPLDGYEAVFDERLPGTTRARVLLSILGGRQVPVVLSAGQLIVRTPGQV